jgi:hypothetical protein
MQIWIFFNAGAGGDGIANLLEKTSNAVTLDGDDKQNWRVHRWVNSKPKFWAPNLDAQGCFRSRIMQPFYNHNNRLKEQYLSSVNDSRLVIVTSHDIRLANLRQSNCQEIFLKKSIMVYIDCDESTRVYNTVIKNLQSSFDDAGTAPRHCPSDFDVIIDSGLFAQDQQYAQQICSSLGIELDLVVYKQYQNLLKGDKTLAPLCNECYTSIQTNNGITYTQI